MSDATQTPQMKAYIRNTVVLMSLYAAVHIAAIFGVYERLNIIGNWTVALLSGALIGAQIWTVLKLVESSDEYVRAFLVRRLGIAAAVSIALFSTWGFGETYANAPHLPGFMVFPLFWVCFSLSFPLLDWLRK